MHCLEVVKSKKIVMRSLFLSVLLSFGFLVYGYDGIEHHQNLRFGSSVGYTTNYSSEGLGVTFGIGYQIDIWKNRLRFSPAITSGTFTTSGITDIPDEFLSITGIICAA